MISICLKITVTQNGRKLNVKTRFLKPTGREPTATEKDAIVFLASQSSMACDRYRSHLARHLRQSISEGVS